MVSVLFDDTMKRCVRASDETHHEKGSEKALSRVYHGRDRAQTPDTVVLVCKRTKGRSRQTASEPTHRASRPRLSANADMIDDHSSHVLTDMLAPVGVSSDFRGVHSR